MIIRLQKIVCLTMAFLFTLLIFSGSASAISGTALRSIIGYTPFYGEEKDGVSAAEACGLTGDSTGMSNKEQIWSYLAGKGLTSIAAAGIMGNLHQENSAFDPAVKQAYSTAAIPSAGDGVTGYGIAQWTSKDRQAGLFKKIDAAGLSKYYGAGYGNPDTNAQLVKKHNAQAEYHQLLVVELDFMWDSDTTPVSGLAKELNAKTSVEGPQGSAMYFHDAFERSGDNAAQLQERVDSAVRLLGELGSNSCGALGGVASIKDGVAWAQKFMADVKSTYHVPVTDLGQKSANGGNSLLMANISDEENSYNAAAKGGCWGATFCGQCVALSGWFVTKQTDYKFMHGNGGEVVGNLKGAGVSTGTEPKPFSVFSTSRTSTPQYGHTGVVLGVLPNGDNIVLQNNYSAAGQVSIDIFKVKERFPDATFAYVGDKLKSGTGGN